MQTLMTRTTVRNATKLSALALNLDIGHKLWGAQTSNIEVIPRYTGLLNQTADPNESEQGGEVL